MRLSRTSGVGAVRALALLGSICVIGVLGSAVAASAQDVKQAGTDVPAPKRTKFVSPTYPPEAQASGQRGIVILELVVDVNGKVGQVTVVRSVPPSTRRPWPPCASGSTRCRAWTASRSRCA